MFRYSTTQNLRVHYQVYVNIPKIFLDLLLSIEIASQDILFHNMSDQRIPQTTTNELSVVELQLENEGLKLENRALRSRITFLEHQLRTTSETSRIMTDVVSQVRILIEEIEERRDQQTKR